MVTVFDLLEEDYVSFEIAKLLKEKGFDWNCITYYVDSEPDDVKYSMLCENNTDWEEHCYSAPTLQMAMKWLRKIHNFHIWVEPNHDKEGLYNAHVKVGWWSNNWAGIGYNTHEKACEAAIKYCLENLI